MTNNDANILSSFYLESKNQKYLKMLEQCKKVAKTNVNVLLIGESGTGKEIASKYIHYHSNRNNNNFVAVNCSSYTDTLLESELFGHEQGSFTGATKTKIGQFELADKGTIFLDEVGDINATTQVKLLRVLETKKVARLGSNKDIDIDFRIISATNRDLIHQISLGNFREDFFYRISSIVISVPSLRERKEDLNTLINFMLEKSQLENNVTIKKIAPEAKDFLQNYSYPGNIRELKSIIDRMVILSDKGEINSDGIPILHSIKNTQEDYNSSSYFYNDIIPFKDFKKQSEADYIKWVLSQTNGNVAEAARKLEVSARQLFNKIKEYNLK